MALKPNQDIAAKMNKAQTSRPAIPVLYEAEFKACLQAPEVQARLKRVKELVEARAQQKLT